MRLPRDDRDHFGARRDRGEDRAATGDRAARRRIGHVVVRADQHRAAADRVGRDLHPLVVEVAVEADDHGVGGPFAQRLHTSGLERLDHARTAEHDRLLARLDQPSRGHCGRQDVALRRDAEALELRDHRADGHGRVVRDEQDPPAARSQTCDRVGRARDGVVREPDDAVEVTDDRVRVEA